MPVPSAEIPALPIETLLDAPRVMIQRVSPCVDAGRYAAKGVVRQSVQIAADVFLDGHDHVSAEVHWYEPGSTGPTLLPMLPLGNDRFAVRVTPTQPGVHRFLIEGWMDAWETYRRDLGKKIDAGVPTALEVQEGIMLVRTALAGAKHADDLHTLVRTLEASSVAAQQTLLLAEPTRDVVRRHLAKRSPAHSVALAIDVERTAAGFSAWYELFPRSQTRDPARHGTFDDVIERLPAIRAMGFDVLYFPPIHPIGKKNRKGKNNSVTAAPGEPGSPYAIGSAEGGHDAVHPALGGIEAFRRLRRAAKVQGLELALDFAVQCAPDHPWLSEHPEWFTFRPDGSIRYAENPPKKYQDIVNVEFYAAEAKPALWYALRDVVQGWVDEGVKIFRVDNPHTKPVPFWRWLIADVRSRHPDVLFLAEAFTAPAMMQQLAKIGFTQSYTYFTWRNTKAELTEYFTELNEAPVCDFFRPHLFVNTPDINPTYLQTSGRAGFVIRATLAATLSGLWGMYSGFELAESAALPGKEEYLDSEKYEIRVRDWNAPGNLISEITRLNRIRQENAALHTHLGLAFHNAFNDQVLWYRKATPDRSSFILVLVSLDPHNVQEVQLEVPLWELDLPDDATVHVEELMRGGVFTWTGKSQHWRFDPAEMPVAIFRITPERA